MNIEEQSIKLNNASVIGNRSRVEINISNFHNFDPVPVFAVIVQCLYAIGCSRDSSCAHCRKFTLRQSVFRIDQCRQRDEHVSTTTTVTQLANIIADPFIGVSERSALLQGVSAAA